MTSSSSNTISGTSTKGVTTGSVKILAFIFDMDGTLLDSEVVWVDAYEEMLRRRGLPATHELALQTVYGKAFTDVYADTKRRHPEFPVTVEQMNDELRAIFWELARSRDLGIPGSVNLLKQLAATHPVCVVSGSSSVDVGEGMQLIGVAPLLKFHLGAEDYAAGKPNPAGFIEAARRLNVPPEACLVFEDSAAGVQAAKRAGMRCVALARPGRPGQNVSEADLILRDLADFNLEAFENRLA